MKNILVIILCLVSCNFAAAQTYSLEQLKDSARQHNISLRTARIGIEQAAEQRKEAFTNFFPQVAATGMWFNASKAMAKMEVRPLEMLPDFMQPMMQALPADILATLGHPLSYSMMKSGTIAGVTAIQPLFVGGQIINGNRLARLGEDVSNLQLQLSENDVEIQTEQYYWQLISLKEKQNTINAARETLDTIYRDASLAVEAGLILRNDLLQVELRRNELESQQLQLNNGAEILRLMLAQHCGLTQLCDVEIPRWEETLSTLPDPTTSGLELLPEYQLLQKQVEAAELQQKIELGKNLPSVAVGACYNYHNLLQNDRTFGMVFATVSIPISSWWGGSHALKRKRLAAQKAREELESNAQLLDIRRRKAWNDVLEAQSQLRLATGTIAQAEENLRVQRECYQAGTITISDLLQAQLIVQQACDRQTDARTRLRMSMVEYRLR